MRPADSLLISPTSTILQAIEAIDRGALQIALIVDDNRKLLGIVTDGDIRRALLRSSGLDTPVCEVMNRHPITLNNHTIEEELLSIQFTSAQIRRFPVVDDANCVIGLRVSEDNNDHEFADNWVVLMAGGLGKRLYPLTDTLPKPMIDIGGRPILEIIINRLSKFGFKHIYISVNYKSALITSYFGDGSRFGVEIKYIHEEMPLGTAGALSLIEELPTSPLLVMNGDVLTNLDFRKLIYFHRDSKPLATMCLRPYRVQIPFGVVEINRGNLIGLHEKPVYEHWINAGVYVLSPQALEYIPRQARFDMTSLFEMIIESNENAQVFPVMEDWIDVGTHEELGRARRVINEWGLLGS